MKIKSAKEKYTKQDQSKHGPLIKLQVRPPAMQD